MYAVVKNHHDGDVPVELFLYLGASDADAGAMSGQGFGTKYSATLCLSKDMEFAKVSSDEKGQYICRFEKEDYEIVAGDQGERVVLVVERKDEDPTRHPMTALVRMASNGWGQHPLGDHYSILREMVIDAADRDPDFAVELVDEMTYAPPGQTWTYVSATEGIRFVVENFDYYFKRNSHVTWLTNRVGFTDTSAENETRLFLTADGAPISYAAWTNDAEEFGTAEQAAFDYVLVETPDEKLASLPKRFIEQEHTAKNLIFNGLRRCKDAKVLAKVFESANNCGWEKGALWWDAGYWQRYDNAAVEALSLLGGGAPIAMEFDVATFEADKLGHGYTPVTNQLYKLASDLGMVTLADTMHTTREGERFVPPTQEDRTVLRSALKLLYEKLGKDCALGHMFMRLESDSCGGKHAPDFGGKDAIAINFEIASQLQEEVRFVAKTILHELGHHFTGELEQDGPDYHSVDYVRELIDFIV